MTICFNFFKIKQPRKEVSFVKKRNLSLLLVSLIATVSLTGCSFFLDVLEDIDKQINDNSSNANFDVEKVDVDGKTIMTRTYKDYSNNCVYNLDYCPNSGNVNLLIIPVWFKDSNYYLNEFKKNKVREDIAKAYLGTNEETGWRSVKTYYEELSCGKLQINGKVTDWYESTYSYKDAGREPSSSYEESTVNIIVKNAVSWYFENNPSDKRSNYDSDGNGYLDGVILIYAAPNYMSINDKSLSNLWAYAYWLQDENHTQLAMPNVYFWASYDFMYSEGIFGSYGYGDTTHCEVDTHTYIHEMGHVFGLEDYYDYSSASYCPAGGFSMQDYNIGSHDPYSTMALGWANPYIVTGNSELTIGTFQKTRDLVVISENWNGIGSPFDEYLILELYSPTGLNAFDIDYTNKGVNAYNRVDKVGLRLWHVDARLAMCTGNDKDYNPTYSPSKLTTDQSKGSYGVYHAFSNTYNDPNYGSVLGSRYYDYNILQLVRRDTSTGLRTTSVFSQNDLFETGSYDLSNYSKQFVNSSPFKMNNGSYANWHFKVTIEGKDDDATAKIEIVK